MFQRQLSHSLYESLLLETHIHVHMLINQSINQISIAPLFQAKPGSVATTAESVFNSKIDETVPRHQRAVGCAGEYEEKPIQ